MIISLFQSQSQDSICLMHFFKDLNLLFKTPECVASSDSSRKRGRLKVEQGELQCIWKNTGNRVFVFLSTSSRGGWVFGFQALFEAPEQNPVMFVFFIFPCMKLPLDLEATVNDEGRAQYRKLVSRHMELTGLQEDRTRWEDRHGSEDNLEQESATFNT